ncbi:MAG: helix-turn-helix domain-containing protein [Deltaproteobacteria bacterium]|nr:helix-turn-helix domain-containing protein [Deltaproteobacteria bacterium]
MQESKYREYMPSPGLQHLLKCYWSYSADFSAGIPDDINPVIPDGCVDIIFDINLCTQSQCFVVGPMTKPIHNSQNNLFGVRFKPGMAGSLFRSPLKEMTDQIFTINKIGKVKTDEIADHLANETCLDNKISFLGSVIEKSLSDLPLLEREIQYGIHAIELSKGMINIQKITSRIGWSRQHFTRMFLNHIGLTPKFFSQVIRINRLIKIYRDKKRCHSLSDLAQIGGYFDQSHMNNEFRKITGITPQKFLKNV